MANELNGKDYILQIDDITPTTASSGADANYKTIGCEVSHSETIEKTLNQTSNKCGGGWTNDTFGDKSWNLSGEYQAIDEDADPSQESYTFMRNLAASDKRVWARRGLIDTGSGAFLPEIEGVVIVQNFNGTFNNNEPVTFSVEMPGQGEPILGTVS